MASLVEQAWAALESVTDPEIPVVSLRELGILRSIEAAGEGLEVVITPTYSGCPAMGQIEDDVAACLARAGIPARVLTRLAPAWTTDWMSPSARAKLHAYGIAPPHPVAPQAPAGAQAAPQVVHFMRTAPAPVACPRCGSSHTRETSRFGSTACKALYQCLDCREPFDYFKPY